jgi:predicted membrane chloride channel (bestrophin family)
MMAKSIDLFFTKLFIWLFIALITMAANEQVGWPSIILGWLMGFVFNSINLNGLNLMNPFEYHSSGVPISSITRDIERVLLQEIGADIIPETLQLEMRLQEGSPGLRSPSPSS